MASIPPDPTAQAAQAIARGDFSTATALLATARAAPGGLTRQGEWLAAQLCRRQDDLAGEQAALHDILAQSPRDIAALLAMADCFVRAGDDRAAVSWFTTALNQAAVTPPAPHLHPLLERAQGFCAEAQRRFAAHLDTAMQTIGITTRGSPALRHAVDLLQGRSSIYLQQPTMFYYPGLPQRCFYEREEFDWVPEFESAAPAMLAEYEALMTRSNPFSPYVQTGKDRPAANNPLRDDDAWGAAYLWKNGERQAALAEACPATMAALALGPQPSVRARSPMALYSRLQPGAHIAPHHGLLNTRLICHLPLITPEGCALRVGHETRAWQVGTMLIFDDSVEHEAWNRGSSDRTILLFEIWRPEIPHEERTMLAALFEAIDTIDPDRATQA